MKKYGFYSKKAEITFGSNLWTTPEGRTVICTYIGDFDNKEDCKYGFDDAICVGEVCDWISSCVAGEIHEF